MLSAVSQPYNASSSYLRADASRRGTGLLTPSEAIASMALETEMERILKVAVCARKVALDGIWLAKPGALRCTIY